VTFPSVLVVDDDEAVSAVMQEILRQAGYDVSGASSAEDTIEIIKKGHVDILIYDLSVRSQPESFDLLASCLKDRPSLAILLITGFANEEARQEAKCLGISLLEKPFEAGTLVAELSSFGRRVA